MIFLYRDSWVVMGSAVQRVYYLALATVSHFTAISTSKSGGLCKKRTSNCSNIKTSAVTLSLLDTLV